jgi:hypothetical protein
MTAGAYELAFGYLSQDPLYGTTRLDQSRNAGSLLTADVIEVHANWRKAAATIGAWGRFQRIHPSSKDQGTPVSFLLVLFDVSLGVLLPPTPICSLLVLSALVWHDSSIISCRYSAAGNWSWHDKEKIVAKGQAGIAPALPAISDHRVLLTR